MPRDLPVGNGSLLVNFDSTYQLRDLYWPHVGQENHTTGHVFRFGVWVEGEFRWLNDDKWQRELNYADDTLVTLVKLYHPDLSLTLICQDTVDFHEDLYIRQIDVYNEESRQREARLFFSHDFHISGNALGDSVYYEPERQAIYHYKGKRWFMINTAKASHEECTLGIDQWATGVKEVELKEGTWRDAEDGLLSGNAVAQGSVDSTVALHLNLPSRASATAYYWIAVGDDFREVTRINRIVRQKCPRTFLMRTHHYWRLWATKQDDQLEELPDEMRKLYRRSLLILRTQIDNDGAIIAANDFDIAHYGRDTYSYMWPRDGALVANALIGAGYSEITRRFFRFCHSTITEEGFLLHKYNPDGSLASSWHGWYSENGKQLPVQEDETALVVWALWQHFQRFRDVEFIKPLFRGLIVRAANWLTTYRDPDTGLPLPSWDLWEERHGILAWTVGATWAGLEAAARFAEAFGEKDLANTYRSAAEQIRVATYEYLWSQRAGRFLRMVEPNRTGGLDSDDTMDASIVGLWYFGMIPPDDPKIISTMESLRDALWVRTKVGGLARYENDTYHQVSKDVNNVPGNPWFICTLWLAHWYLATAKTAHDIDAPLELMQWASTHALSSGVMAEQVNPYTSDPVSVSPLTWSHATFVSVVHEFLTCKRK